MKHSLTRHRSWLTRQFPTSQPLAFVCLPLLRCSLLTRFRIENHHLVWTGILAHCTAEEPPKSSNRQLRSPDWVKRSVRIRKQRARPLWRTFSTTRGASDPFHSQKSDLYHCAAPACIHVQRPAHWVLAGSGKTISSSRSIWWALGVDR